MTARANLLLAKQAAGANWRAGVEKRLTIEDLGLQLRDLPQGGVEVRSPSVFLDPQIVDALPSGGVQSLTYLVNEIRAGDNAVPYSMVTGVDTASSGFLPAEMMGTASRAPSDSSTSRTW